ncbi:MAG: hypothetical protein ACLGGV_06710 [Bacteroidia bacterium]
MDFVLGKANTFVMAKYKGPYNLNGKLGDLVFVGAKNSYVRRNDVARGELLKKDGRFENVRKVQSEFGLASMIGKHIREALEPYNTLYRDEKLNARLQAAVFSVILKDEKEKGKRVFDFGNDPLFLKGLEWHASEHKLGKSLEYVFSCKRDKKVLNISLDNVRLKKRMVGFAALVDVVVLYLPEHIQTAKDCEKICAEVCSVEVQSAISLRCAAPKKGMEAIVLCGLRFVDETGLSIGKGMRVDD